MKEMKKPGENIPALLKKKKKNSGRMKKRTICLVHQCVLSCEPFEWIHA